MTYAELEVQRKDKNYGWFSWRRQYAQSYNPFGATGTIQVQPGDRVVLNVGGVRHTFEVGEVVSTEWKNVETRKVTLTAVPA